MLSENLWQACHLQINITIADFRCGCGIAVILFFRAGTGWKAAWINDLQGGRLESGVNTGSQGSPSVEQARARLLAVLLAVALPPMTYQVLWQSR
ncbi:hypothetical protein JZU54_04960, partial [bacterium]|nr:hypothetical protein [bacterium]